MFRSLLLYLAGAAWARRLLTSLPGSRRAAQRFVAGETLDDAIKATRALNQNSLLVTLDHLGENVHSEADAQKACQAYLDLLDRIQQTGVQSNVSLKLTQLGLDLGEEICLANMRHICGRAKQHGNFVRIDMEGTPYTDRTLRIYRTLRDEYDFANVGVVIQSYLFRSKADVEALASEGANIRLCKGAYNEPPDVAFPEKADVDKNYVALAEYYLSEPARAKGAYIGVATHDDNMINAVREYAAKNNIPKDRFEFQMLYGVRSASQLQLAKEGYKMRVYVPYGTEWYPFFMRRLAERPANVWFLLKNLFRT
jgi:proline dehydrogenase